MIQTYCAPSQETMITAQHCYDQFFSKKYSLTDNEKYPTTGTIKGHIVQRPNHALAHTLRKVHYVPYVIAAFNINETSNFIYNNVSLNISSEIENIQTALLFSVVGRESEASYNDDPVRYNQFRKKSADSYSEYILKNKERVPRYQQLVQSKMITFYKNIVESPHANRQCLISRIFRVCHSLDLARCYTRDEYSSASKAIKSDFELDGQRILKSPVVVSDLITFATNCLSATGDMNYALKTPRNPELFVACSINVKSCCDFLQKVTHPGFMASKPQAPVAQTLFGQAPVAQAVGTKSGDTHAYYEKAKNLYATQNYSEAFKYYLHVANAGLSEAQYMTGMCYYKGRGVPINHLEAVKYLQASANQGDPNALYMVGLCSYNGYGVPKDLVRAKRYIQNASTKGSIEANTALQTLFK